MAEAQSYQRPIRSSGNATVHKTGAPEARAPPIAGIHDDCGSLLPFSFRLYEELSRSIFSPIRAQIQYTEILAAKLFLTLLSQPIVEN